MNDAPFPGAPKVRPVPVLEMVGADVPGFEGEGPPLLRNVGWRVETGSFHIVAGPPASGKSALLAAAAGLLRLEKGAVRLFGESLHDMTESALIATRHKVGIVFADGGRVFHQMTVQENVSLPLRYHRDCGEAEVASAVAVLLESAGLREFAHVTPGRLGRGQRQRAALARALALGPELLILDNPLAALDPREARWWLDMVHGLWRGHPMGGGNPMTIIVAADDPRPWLEHGRLCVVADQGRLTEAGAAMEASDSANPVLRELLGGG